MYCVLLVERSTKSNFHHVLFTIAVYRMSGMCSRTRCVDIRGGTHFNFPHKNVVVSFFPKPLPLHRKRYAKLSILLVLLQSEFCEIRGLWCLLSTKIGLIH